MADEPEAEPDSFAVLAEAAGHDRPLIMIGLTFARLLDDIIIPFESKAPFFIDGAPLTRENVRRLKIIRTSKFFRSSFADLHWRLRASNLNDQRAISEQYQIRVEALMRESGEDVTSQVIKAFDTTIRPRLKDYLPKRAELIEAATKVFLEGVKALGGS